MPISLPALSRRDFLRGTLAAGAGLMIAPTGFGAEESPTDPHRFALLADTHIPSGPEITARNVNMTENLQQISSQIRKLDRRPAAALIAGDCAYLKGLTEDYANLVGLLKPLRAHGVPIHLALGNHDHRERFWQALPPTDAVKDTLADRHVTVLRSPRVNWFLLDSLDKTNSTPGVLGAAQQSWLAKSLDANADRPAIVLVHHNPDTREQTSGLRDTSALLDMLSPRKHVKAVFFGHTHYWSHVQRQDGLHLVNLPPSAYVFTAGMPNGWVDAHVTSDGLNLELQCLDAKHPRHRETLELSWRG